MECSGFTVSPGLNPGHWDTVLCSCGQGTTVTLTVPLSLPGYKLRVPANLMLGGNPMMN